jgi:hypothetical protein
VAAVNRQKLVKYFILSPILYTIIWVVLSVWEVQESRKNDWLVNIEADPAAQPLPFLDKDSWSARLASPNFASMAIDARLAAAKLQYEEKKVIASQQGFDLKALEAWYNNTATNFERYPVKTFTFSQNQKDYYRDLSESGFPSPSVLRVFGRAFFSWNALFALVGVLFVAFLLPLDHWRFYRCVFQKPRR